MSAIEYQLLRGRIALAACSASVEGIALDIVFVLVETSHPGNIGAAARAMKNMAFSDLRLVRPKYFPHAEATARASGADDVLARAGVYESVPDALADCQFAFAASARQRTITWPEYTPTEAQAKISGLPPETRAAFVFGPETSGLTNTDIGYCQGLVCIPSNTAFGSLNLAMAVQVIAYQLFALAQPTHVAPQAGKEPPARHEDLEKFLGYLESVLVESEFLDPENPRHLMQRLRRLISRAEPSGNDVNILRGILAALWAQRAQR